MVERKPVGGTSPDEEKRDERATIKEITDSLRDPYSLTTRKARRNLLATSVVGLLIVYAQVIPEKIPALGITFTPGNQSALLTGLALIVVYQIAAFVLYALSDQAAHLLETTDDKKFRELGAKTVARVLFTRTWFDFLVPTALGFGAASVLFTTDPSMFNPSC